MSGMLQVAYMLADPSEGSSLNATALRFIEPSQTAKDKFLGINEKGRMISVESQNINVHDMSDGEGHHELLPLNIFFNLIGATNLNSFKITGDPKEFSAEIRDMAESYSSNFILSPWRVGHFFESLFWSTAAKVFHCFGPPY